jgi:DNA-binding response OmpR family regulator
MNENKNKAILVIDDDEDLTRALSKRLASYGYSCVSAVSGAQGLALFGASRFDLVISDLNMPGGDGVALAEAIRRVSLVPIVFITGFRDDFKRRLRDLKNVITLRKPFSSDTLLDAINAALGSVDASMLPAAAAKEGM